MNNFEYDLLNNYFEQLSFKTENTIRELQLVQKHINEFKHQIYKKDISEKTRAEIPKQELSIERSSARERLPTDLIKIKEVIEMTGLSRSSIYRFVKLGEFPKPINLSSRSVAWVRGSVEEWVLDKIENN